MGLETTDELYAKEGRDARLMISRLIPPGRAWAKALARCGNWDFYHRHDYHELVCGDHKPLLFHFNQANFNAVLPLVVNGELALSVCGYPGPIHSDNAQPDDLLQFAISLAQKLAEMNIRSVETRLHPILSQSIFFDEVATKVGEVVVIDLAAEPTVTKGHRYDIRKARERGINAVMDDWSLLPTFTVDYQETMKRNQAREDYFFSYGYFDRLLKLPGAHLWAAVNADGRVYSLAIFLESLDIVTYHLSATPDREIEAGTHGAKVIIDGVIAWAKKHNKKWVNLGGGLGADPDDSLFRFKAGFSKLRLPFRVARWEVK